VDLASISASPLPMSIGNAQNLADEKQRESVTGAAYMAVFFSVNFYQSGTANPVYYHTVRTSIAVGQLRKEETDEIESGTRPAADERTKSAAACVDLGRDARGAAAFGDLVAVVWHWIHVKADTGRAELNARRSEFVNVIAERGGRNQHGRGCDVSDDHFHRERGRLVVWGRDDFFDPDAIPVFQ
jgi:hypothetical protein